MYAVEMRGITKRFPGMIANDQIEFLVEKGEIHSLLGENGAGKTTLMKILFGLYQPDGGSIKINGNEIKHQTAVKAFEMGLGMVHQHFMLIDNMTVWENIVLGSEPGNFMIDRKKGKEIVKHLSEKYHFDLDVDAKISGISVGMKQRVEILKTLYRGAEIIILDEPTAVLTPLEVEQLLQILMEMKKEGKTIIFITHKLKETMAVSDHVTILRSGKSVEFLKTTETTEKELAALMVGYEIDMTLERKKVEKGETILSLQNVRLLPQAEKTVDLEIRAGEILGIAGVEGNGQQQLEEMIMGLEKVKCGKIFFKQEEITGMSVKERCKRGIGYIPSDRYKRAILPGFSLKDNYLLGNQYKDSYARKGMLNQEYIEKKTKELMEKFDVRAVNGDQLIGALSGGNQQKLVLSREVDKDPDLILACQPVRGLDIGAIKFIHNVLLELRNQGKAVLLISAELSDLFQLSDRIGVLYKGEMMSLQETEKYTTESISLLMAGKKGV